MSDAAASPWFEEVSTIDTAASSIFDQYQQALAAATPEQKALSFVAETGWPSASDPGEQSLGGSASGSENMQSQSSRSDVLPWLM